MGAQLVFLFAVVLCFGFYLTPVGSVTLQQAAERINAHIVAHTHDDVGWLKTVDEYYMGANNSIQEAGVQYILDSVVLALLANPERKFIYVEIAFFERWWNEQTEQAKNIVRDLVATKRLEFINGGWCMNDEAGTDYEAIIDQMTEGHTFLFNEFGVRPTIGWHIDPFGHASTQASLFAQMGFNAFFFARIDYQDRDLRNKTRELEMVWRGSKSLGKSTEIFTGVLYDGYGPPDGFCFECDDGPPIQDDPRIFNVNVKERADKFVADLKQRRNSMKHNNVLIPFGSDFQYSNANVNFKNMDKLMKYIRDHPEYGVDIFYSTPSIYVDYVHDYAQKNNIVWSVKTDDFFPYADNPHSYWTGYFTSRSALKNYVRTRSAILHSTEKLHVTARGILSDEINTPAFYEKIDKLAQAMAVAQHHDAVAGTEKQHVADDYAERLSIGTNASIDVISDLVSRLLIASKTSKESKIIEDLEISAASAAVPAFQFCEFLNVSLCPALLALGSGQSVPVVAYNPIAWDRTEYFRLPVPMNNVEVVLSNGQPVASQVYQNGDIKSQYTLAFSVPIPAMSYISFVVQPRAGKNPNFTPVHEVSATMPTAPYVTLENEYLRVQFDTATGRLSSITNKQNNQLLQVNQELVWYNASAGNNNLSSQASGAYIFRPNRTATFNLTSGNIASLSFINGSFVQEVRQMWTPWAYQTVRLYTGARHLEMEHTVGPIDISDNLGKEVVSRYSSSLATDAGWYTDSEGQEMQYRKRNYRPTWKLNVTEPVAGNYYPMNTASYMQDNSKDLRMTLINDRSQGCASINDGQLEVMVQRRLLYDDGRGVGEPLNESAPIRTVHKVIVDRTANSARQQRVQSLLLNNPAVLLFGTGWRGSSSTWFSTFNTNFSPLVKALPYNVHILTLRAVPTSINDVLLRLNHIFAVGEDSVYSAPATLDISQLFNNLRVTNIVEMTLSANQPLSEEKRLQWRTASSSSSSFEENVEEEEEKYQRVPLQGTVVTLKPMEIRTFIVRFMQSV